MAKKLLRKLHSFLIWKL